jgi:hypothetical protein
MSYINPSPGVADAQVILILKKGSTANVTIPALQNVTINNANDVFTWTQLDSGSKQTVATTATNSLSMSLVLDQATFFGNASASAGTTEKAGVFGLSKDKTLTTFYLYMGDQSDSTAGKTISGQGYITGLAPTVSADAPVWVSPITISVTGDYTVG